MFKPKFLNLRQVSLLLNKPKFLFWFWKQKWVFLHLCTKNKMRIFSFLSN